MIEAWEEEQMSNLGCESVSDLIAEVKRLREALITMRDECDDFNDLGKRLHDFIRKEMIE